MLLYAQTLDDPWHFDDLAELTPAVREFAPRVIASHYRGIVVRWSWAIDYRLGGDDPGGFHVTNTLVHLGNVLLVYWLAWLLGAGAPLDRRRFTATAAAAIFCAHPLATQSVTYLTQRSTSLAALFFLLSLCGWIVFRRMRGRARWALWGVSLMALALGLLSKHVALMVPAAIVAFEVLFPSRSRRIALVALLPFVLLTGARALDYAPQVRVSQTVGARPAGPATPRNTATGARSHHYAAEYALTQPRSIVTYLGLFAWPQGQNLDHDVRPARSATEPTVIGALALLAALAFAAWRTRRRRPLAAFGVSLFFLALLPTSSFVRSADLLFEHRAYLPMAGLCLAFADVGAAAVRRRRDAWIVLALLVTALSIATARRNAIWDTELTLWADTAAKSPHKFRPQLNLALALHETGRLGEAERHHRRALTIRPGHPFAQNNLGNVLRRRGRPEEAEALFRAALEERPGYVEPRINLGNLAVDRGDFAAAVSFYREALELGREAPGIWFNLGFALEADGRSDEAVEAYERALELAPDLAAARERLHGLRSGGGGAPGVR